MSRPTETNTVFSADSLSWKRFRLCLAVTSPVLVMRTATGVQRASLIAESENVDEATAMKEWEQLAQRKFLERREQRRRHDVPVRSHTIFIIGILLAVMFISSYWPIWTLILDDAATSNHLRVLGIPSSATRADVRAAYKRAAREWHPDRNPGCGSTCRLKMNEIQNAYDVLSSSENTKRLVDDNMREIAAFVLSLLSGQVLQSSLFAVAVIGVLTNLSGQVLYVLRITLDILVTLYVYHISHNPFLVFSLGISILRNSQADGNAARRVYRCVDAQFTAFFIIFPTLVFSIASGIASSGVEALWSLRWDGILWRTLLSLFHIVAFIGEMQFSPWQCYWQMLCILPSTRVIYLIWRLIVLDLFAFFIGVPNVGRIVVLILGGVQWYLLVALPSVTFSMYQKEQLSLEAPEKRTQPDKNPTAEGKRSKLALAKRDKVNNSIKITRDNSSKSKTSSILPDTSSDDDM